MYVYIHTFIYIELYTYTYVCIYVYIYTHHPAHISFSSFLAFALHMLTSLSRLSTGVCNTHCNTLQHTASHCNTLFRILISI